MKIIGFAQLRNELEKGNLENWFKCMQPICDYIYIYDQNSTDGSLEYYKKFNNAIVIASSINRFTEEMICKDELLKKIIAEQPDADWIFWMDGDTLLDGRLLKNNGDEFRKLCASLNSLENQAYEGFILGHKNLWRSDTYWRSDNQYDYLDARGICAIWRFRRNLSFPLQSGLHSRTHPININNNKRIDQYKLIHRGFSTDYQILLKYEIYGSRGQSGWALDRFLDETTLSVERLDLSLLPDWFNITDDTNPIEKRKLRDIYNEMKKNGI